MVLLNENVFFTKLVNAEVQVTQFLLLHINKDILPPDYGCIVYLLNVYFFLFFMPHITSIAICGSTVFSFFSLGRTSTITTQNIYRFIFTWCRPCDRNLRDAELISCRLRRVEPLCRLPGSALQQLAMCGFYEDLEKGITREYCYLEILFSFLIFVCCRFVFCFYLFLCYFLLSFFLFRSEYNFGFIRCSAFIFAFI